MKYKNESGDWINGPKGDKGDPGPKGRDYNKEELAEDLFVREVARNRVLNPLMPDAGTVTSWTQASSAQPDPYWEDGALRWQPTGAGSNVVTSTIVAEAGETITVTLKAYTGSLSSRPRVSLYSGITVNDTSKFAQVEGVYDGNIQTLVVTGTLPPGETRFRVGVTMLGSAAGSSTLSIWEVTTADEAFDGNTMPSSPLERIEWQGDPYLSGSIKYYGALQETILSSDVVRVEYSDVAPAHNPDKQGTLYITPTPRTPIFTSLDSTLSEVTPRWDLQHAWTEGTSSVIKPETPSYLGRMGLSLNTASRAEDAEILVLGSLATAHGTGSHLWGPVLRGEGLDGDPITGTGIWLSLSVSSSKLRLYLGEYRPANATLTSVAMSPDTVPAVGQKYWQRLRVSGTSIFGKAWPQGTTEPVDWMISDQATVTGSGWIGVKGSASASVSIDAIGVSYDEGKAPGAY